MTALGLITLGRLRRLRRPVREQLVQVHAPHAGRRVVARVEERGESHDGFGAAMARLLDADEDGV